MAIKCHVLTNKKTNTMTKFEIIQAINEMTQNELVQLNNEYCQQINASDSEIFINDEEFFNTFFDNKPFEVARSTFYGDYNFSHEYVIFNGYGNLETFGYMDVSKLCECVETMAEYIEENFNEFKYIFN
jgi:hypothetical protein